MIIALAGRRVDRPEAKKTRFAPANVELVRGRIRLLLKESGATVVVSSAACGADLIALAEAGGQGLRRRVILPFDRRRFRETSVTDRPGEWGPIYDEILDDVEAAGDLVVLMDASEDKGYAAANSVIIEEAAALAKVQQEPAIAVIIWDGVSRGDDDLTEQFAAEARKRGMAVREVLTI